MSNIGEFENKLSDLINSCSLDNRFNTPDFILARYLVSCLLSYDEANVQNRKWHNETLDKLG
jgi:hypothetical protein